MKQRITGQCQVLIVSVLFCLCIIHVHAAGQAPPSLTNPNIKKLSERVYVLEGDVNTQTPQNQGFNANTTFVITTDGVVVMDPGGSVRIGRMVIEQIRKITNKPISHVFNSDYRSYISLLYREVEKYYQKGYTDLEMMDRIDVGEYRNMSGFKNRFPVNVNSMYLEIVKKSGKKLFLQQIGISQN